MSQSVEQIERELEETRRHAVATAEALKERLSPRSLARQALKSPLAVELDHLARMLAPVAILAVVGIIALRALRARGRPGPPPGDYLDWR